MLAICTISLGIWRGYFSLDPGPVLDPLCYSKISRVLLFPLLNFPGHETGVPFVSGSFHPSAGTPGDGLISYAGHEFKFNLFADDDLLTLTNPLITLPNL